MGVISAAQVASAVSKCGTVGAARAALGYVSAVLGQGYVQVPNINDSGLQSQAQTLLDTVNGTAQTLYNLLPTDDASQNTAAGDDVIDFLGDVISQADNALSLIEGAVNTNFNFFGGLQDAIAEWGNEVGSIPKLLPGAIAQAGIAFLKGAWPTLALIAVGIFLYYYLQARLAKALV